MGRRQRPYNAGAFRLWKLISGRVSLGWKGLAKVTIDQWTAKSQARLEAVWKTAAQDIAREVQTPRAKGGKLPVDTAFMRNSFAADINSTPGGNGNSPYSAGPISIVIGRAKIGDRVVFGWGANYAIYMEARYGFLRGAAQNWQQIVDKAAKKVQRRVG